MDFFFKCLIEFRQSLLCFCIMSTKNVWKEISDGWTFFNKWNCILKNTVLIRFLISSLCRHNLELQLNLEVIKKKAKKSSKDRSLIGNVFTPLYLLSLVVMCITQLRLLFFIGSLTSMLEGITGGDTETGNDQGSSC